MRNPPCTRLVLALLCALSLASCVDRRASTPPSMEVGLGDAMGITPPTIPLAPVKLNTQGEFDAFEEALLERMSPGDLVPILEDLAADAKPSENPRDVILLQRLALLHLRSGQGATRLQKAFSVADRLRNEAPRSPHTLYLLSHITQLLLRRAADGAFHLSAQRRDIAERLSTSWATLLAVAPDYVGPYGRTTDELRQELSALRAAMEAMDDLPLPDGLDAPAPGLRKGSSSLVEASRVLRGIETRGDGDTVSLCNDWEREHGGDEDLGRLGHWLSLRCAAALRSPDRALRALTDLVRDGAAIAPCRWLVRIHGGSEAAKGALDKAMQERGLRACGPGGE